MKLAEALILRADQKRLIGQLKHRMENNVRVLEGETPAENIEDLITQFEEACQSMVKLISRINRTNSITTIGENTLIDVIVKRDTIGQKLKTYKELYNTGISSSERFFSRETKYVRCMDLSELQNRISTLSKAFRELDTEIQKKNWETELAE